MCAPLSQGGRLNAPSSVLSGKWESRDLSHVCFLVLPVLLPRLDSWRLFVFKGKRTVTAKVNIRWKCHHWGHPSLQVEGAGAEGAAGPLLRGTWVCKAPASSSCRPEALSQEQVCSEGWSPCRPRRWCREKHPPACPSVHPCGAGELALEISGGDSS